MPNEEYKIVVPLDRYETLIETESKYWLLLDMLVDTATLTWRNDNLDFDNSTIQDVVKMLAPVAVRERIAALRKEKGLDRDDTVVVNYDEQA